MQIIDNLKKLFERSNWRLLTLVIWLLVGVAIIQFIPIVGIFIFLPFLTFLMFLFLFSLASRKNVLEYKPWKIILLLILSLPLLLLLSIILIALFAFSILSYFFFTSWFMLYACYLVGRGIDKKLFKYPKSRPFLRIIIFFGGLAGSLMLLYLFIIGPTIFDFSAISTVEVPLFLILAYIIIGVVIVGLAIIGIVLMFKKVFNAWLGMFFILITFYTLFLIIRIYLGLGNGEALNVENVPSIWTTIGMLVVDLLIILYSLSTLMGSNAEMLAKRSKHLGIDTAIIWLIFSKVAYEFIRYFPYSLFEQINIPWINALSALDNDIINLAKNIAVLAFFIVLLLVIGIYEIRKYNKEQKGFKTEDIEGIKKLISPVLAGEEESHLSELNKINDEIDLDITKQKSNNLIDNQNEE